MRWRSIVLAGLAIGFGIAAGLCIGTETRLYAAMDEFYSTLGDTSLTAAQAAKAGALNAQLSALHQFAGPIVAGSLLCLVGLLIVLAWRWQTRRITGQDESAATRTINAAGST
jgi:hypothetical protein